MMKAAPGDRVELVEIDGAGHALLPEQPETIAAADHRLRATASGKLVSQCWHGLPVGPASNLSREVEHSFATWMPAARNST